MVDSEGSKQVPGDRCSHREVPLVARMCEPRVSGVCPAPGSHRCLLTGGEQDGQRGLCATPSSGPAGSSRADTGDRSSLES